MRNIILSIFIITLSACSSDSDFQLVKHFIDADFNGERLGDGHEGLMHLVAWEDEPGWEEVMMVSEYRLEKSFNGIKVEFITHGYCPNGEFTKPTSKSYIFKTTTKDGNLVIKEPLYTPHVSREIACERFPHCCEQGM